MDVCVSAVGHTRSRYPGQAPFSHHTLPCRSLVWGKGKRASAVSHLSFYNFKLWLSREWSALCLSAHAEVYLWLTGRLRTAVKQMQNHLAGPQTLWPEERDYSETYWTLTSFVLRKYFKFVEMRNSRSLLEEDQNMDSQRWWPKMQVCLFGLKSKLLVRTLKMSPFLIILPRVRYSFSSPSVSYWFKFRVCRDCDHSLVLLNKVMSSSYPEFEQSIFSSKTYLSSLPFGESTSFWVVDVRSLQVMSVFLKACRRKMPLIMVKNPLRVPMISPAFMPYHSWNKMAEQVTTMDVKNT